MGVVGHCYGRLVGAGIEVVDGMHAGQNRGGVVCREMPEHFPSVRGNTDDTTVSRCTVLGRVEPELVDLQGMALAREVRARLRSIVHEDNRLHGQRTLSSDRLSRLL